MVPYNNFKFEKKSEKSFNSIYVALILKYQVVASISRIFSMLAWMETATCLWQRCWLISLQKPPKKKEKKKGSSKCRLIG